MYICIPDKKETHRVKLISFSESRKCNTNFVCIISYAIYRKFHSKVSFRNIDINLNKTVFKPDGVIL